MKSLTITYRRPTTESYLHLPVPNSVLKKALQQTDKLEGTCQILAYVMDNSPSDNHSDWDIDMTPLLDIESFKPHILDLFISRIEEEYEDD